jgi:adenine deaminase
MATLNPAVYHGLSHVGAVAPGYQADMLLLPDLESFLPELVLKRGAPVGEIRRTPVPEWAKRTVHLAGLDARAFAIPWTGGEARVIGLCPGQILTRSLVAEPTVVDGFAVADPGRDLAKIVVFERHLETGRIGRGFVHGFGLERGAFASTVAHDAHNLVVVGVEDAAMLAVVARLRELGGGIAVADSGGVLAELPLPVAGLVSDRPLAEVLASSRAVAAAVAALGVSFPQPVQTLAFLSLSVIPALKITDRGLVDVDRFELVPLALGDDDTRPGG